MINYIIAAIAIVIVIFTIKNIVKKKGNTCNCKDCDIKCDKREEN